MEIADQVHLYPNLKPGIDDAISFQKYLERLELQKKQDSDLSQLFVIAMQPKQ